jgi:hypothetical protein
VLIRRQLKRRAVLGFFGHDPPRLVDELIPCLSAVIDESAFEKTRNKARTRATR